MTVEEGDSGTRNYEIPVSVSGNSAGTVRLFVADENGEYTPRLLTVHPGHQTVEIPFQVTGNTRWSTGTNLWVLAKALQGTVSGGYVGGLTVLNDDPKPAVAITPAVAEAAEGGVLTWTATSDAVADSPIFWYVWAVPPSQGPELSSTDVDPQWFRENTFGEDPEPSRPLSGTGLLLVLLILPGELTGDLTVPTAADDEAEPTEHLRLHLLPFIPDGIDRELVGTVTDVPAGP
jgi:hypothetical protein